MDFTSQRILLAAGGGAEPDTYYYAYVDNIYNNYGISSIAVDDDDGDVYLGWIGYNATHNILHLDKEGNKVNIYNHTGAGDGKGLAIKSNGHVYSMTSSSRFHLSTLNLPTTSVVSYVDPGSNNSYNDVNPYAIFTYGSDVYLCGRWRYTGGYPQTYGPSIFKLNSSNTIQWVRKVQSSYGYQSWYAQGNNGDIAFYTQENSSGNSVQVGKLNTSGTISGSNLISNISGHNIEGPIGIDGSGDIIVLTKANVAIYSPSYISWYNGILAKVNGSTGALIWMKEIYKYNTTFSGYSAVAAGDDGTIHVVSYIGASGSSVEYMYMRINSSGTKIYERKIAHTINTGISVKPRLTAKNKNIYFSLSRWYTNGSDAVFILKLPDSGDISGSYNQVSITNVGTYYSVQNLGSNYSQTPSSSSTGGYTHDFTSSSSINNTSLSGNSVTTTGWPLTSYNFTDYTLPL